MFRSPSNYCNGNTRDLQGWLITCERRRMARTEYAGTITILIDPFEGKSMNSPNDTLVYPDGQIWFTVPCHGMLSFIPESNR